MSQTTVIAEIKACLQDASVGLAANVEGIAGLAAELIGLEREQLLAEFQFTDSRPQATLLPTSTPIVSVRAVRWAPAHRTANIRGGTLDVEVRYENFIADPFVAKTNSDIVGDALALVLDGLREYSDAHAGTIIDVLADNDVMVSIVSGLFDEPASTGFLATFRVQERTTYA